MDLRWISPAALVATDTRRRRNRQARVAVKPGMQRIFLGLAALVLLAGCGIANGDSSTGSSNVQGRTVAAPGCPLQATANPCKASPVQADISATRQGSATVVARTTSDPDGSFALDLSPGSYTVTAVATKGLPMPQTKSAEINVPQDGQIKVTITFDSGIRTPTS